MKELFGAIALTLSISISLGLLDPSMTLGEFVGAYSPQPQAVSAEREAAETVIPAENAVPKPEAEVPLIIVNEPAIPETVPTAEPVTPEVTLTVGDLVTPEVTLTVEQAMPVISTMPEPSEADFEKIARIINVEGGKDFNQQVGVGACFFNRVVGWGQTIQEVASSGAFKKGAHYTEENLLAAKEAYRQMALSDEERVLPSGYYYFNGNGKQNFFRKELSGERLALP